MEPFIGEIRLFAGNFAPWGWALCDGSLLPISENDALFVLLGTTYGGDGQETFGLPDLRGRVPMHMGTNPNSGITSIIGEMAGVEAVTLSTQQIPAHNHAFLASTDIPMLSSPANAVPGQAASKLYRATGTTAQMAAAMVQPAGGSQPHDNMQPYVCINYIIALFGIFPSQT